MLNVRTLRAKQSLSVPTSANGYGTISSRPLTQDMMLVWRMPPPALDEALAKKRNPHREDDDHSRWLRSLPSFAESTKGSFFIHKKDTEELCYSDIFTGQLCDVSVTKQRLIFMDDQHLRMIDLATKSTLLDTNLAPDLVHVGFVLTRYWVAQHPNGGFYAMDLCNPDHFSEIPCQHRAWKQDAVANSNSIVKVVDNEILFWHMNRII
ncbi:hypothetical protein SYNPS1DRAFT_21885 [Syncephalis pseudoplumigaleata]|uniref:Uncharacterized protein n=1 Tax=Syncephalis pseudoplumigaleata TaxID=1712513 RepID=A0A4P9Z1V7_9FUNG|nr:hypothetical protein SYNPS1DRAFT_21885 [Syncephalis pseudoplumigaleata]|eukprot:RKP26335.1 hypothetical protein SYNPS1DRAFT_21885 [Syncephalis pseudoplumigaleata]